MNIKTLFSYFGSKLKLAPKIVSLLPSPCPAFVDLFGGSGAVLLNKPKPTSRRKEKEVFNDINENLFNLFRVLQTEEGEQELQSRLCYRIYSRRAFEYYLQRYLSVDAGKETPSIDRAESYLYLMACSRTWDNAKPVFAGSSDSRGKNFEDLGITLRNIFWRFGSVSVECKDYHDCLSYYRKYQPYVYADPPYTVNAIGRHYEGGATFDHPRFFQVMLHEAREHDGRILLSSYYSKYVKLLERADWQILGAVQQQSFSGSTTGKTGWREELLCLSPSARVSVKQAHSVGWKVLQE